MNFPQGIWGPTLSLAMLGYSSSPHANTDVSPTPTPQTSLPSQLQAPEGPHHLPWLSQPGDLWGLERTQVPVLSVLLHPVLPPQETGDARTPQEGPALQAIGQASPGDVLGTCCQMVCKYNRPTTRGQAEQEGSDKQQQPQLRMGWCRDATLHHRRWPPRDITDGFSGPMQLLLLLPRVQLSQLSHIRGSHTCPPSRNITMPGTGQRETLIRPGRCSRVAQVMPGHHDTSSKHDISICRANMGSLLGPVLNPAR